MSCDEFFYFAKTALPVCFYTKILFTCTLLQWGPFYLYAFTPKIPLPVCFYMEVPFTWMLLHQGPLYLYAFCGPLGEDLSWQKLGQQSILYVNILHQLHPVFYQDVFLGLIHHQSPPLMVKQ